MRYIAHLHSKDRYEFAFEDHFCQNRRFFDLIKVVNLNKTTKYERKN